MSKIDGRMANNADKKQLDQGLQFAQVYVCIFGVSMAILE